jgi:hypothetical protein
MPIPSDISVLGGVRCVFRVVGTGLKCRLWRREPYPKCPAIGAVVGGLMLLRDKPFELLDGVGAFERLVLAVEAVHLDTETLTAGGVRHR